MYLYKDDICIIPDKIKRMSEDELKAEIARIKQSSTPKKALSPLHYRIILNKHFSCCRYPLQQDFIMYSTKKPRKISKFGYSLTGLRCFNSYAAIFSLMWLPVN